MKKLVTLKKDYDIKLKSNITKHTTPKYVFIETNDNQTNMNKDVKKEEKISDTIVSPVSGKIVGTKYCQIANGNTIKCFSILNDYKETVKKRNASLKDMADVSLEKMLLDLKKFGQSNLAEKLQKAKKASVLILNGIEDEPYVANEIFLNKEYTKIILEMLDTLRERLQVSKTKVVIKNNDSENIESFENLLGTYTEIELQLIPDYYMIGNETLLKEFLKISSDCFILKPSEIKKIWDVVKRHRYITEHIFTISGNALLNPQVVEAKIGSSIKEILEEHIKMKKNVKEEYMINGVMTGKKMEVDNLIVTEELNSIMIMEQDEISEKECMNCGKCVQICPVDCNPKKVYDTQEKKYAKDCIDCGLCSYICPSFINLRKYLKGEDHE